MKNLSRYKTTTSKSLMKSLFLIAIASLVSVGVYAQTETSIRWTDNNIKTLNCTEDAVSLKLFVKAGWHINSLHVGNVAPVKTSFDFLPLNPYSTKGPVIESTSSVNPKTESDTNVSLSRDTIFKPTITRRAPKANNVLDKLSYIPWANKTPNNTSTNFIISTNNKPLNF
jgi:thiol:disulfide interchange protein DsbD